MHKNIRTFTVNLQETLCACTALPPLLLGYLYYKTQVYFKQSYVRAHTSHLLQVQEKQTFTCSLVQRKNGYKTFHIVCDSGNMEITEETARTQPFSKRNNNSSYYSKCHASKKKRIVIVWQKYSSQCYKLFTWTSCTNLFFFFF